MGIRILLLMIALYCSSKALAATASATMAISGQLTGTLAVRVETAPGSVSGGGTDAATSSLGTVSKYGGTVPTGMTRSVTTNDWTLTATNVRLSVVKSNSSSTSFTLLARLTTSPASGVTWMFGGYTLGSTADSLITTTGTYGTETFTGTLAIVMTNAVSGTVANTVRFTAMAN